MLQMGIKNKENLDGILKFLLDHRLIFDVSEVDNSNSRFIRQTTFWDDFVLDRSGTESQLILERKKIVLLGCGATGSKLLEVLVRSGVNDITIVDYKNLSESNRTSHNYYDKNYVGKPKVEALQDFLLKINKNIEVNPFNEKLFPHTDISKWIPDDSNLIINTLDEPYIGHTSLKVGRYAQIKKIPFYVGGGFDAHLMSSGEIVNPPHTPCIDCIQNTFSNALKDWKPIYTSLDNLPAKLVSKDLVKRSNYIAGGAGGLSAMSSFSANLSALKLVNFLLDDSAFSYDNERLEYLPNKGEMTIFKFEQQPKCKICNE
ncbi:ThiF family adenylyltransferase [Candidatus Pantoea multigeneris]|uniref:ThiF family adenylyltransferase n=1 Tax=Candidatus Pantoea multigeneris TaxID=2608357 RepID=UPI001F038233|nr:ThiF family adenylyltransferase [Pantoea multigeneris]